VSNGAGKVMAVFPVRAPKPLDTGGSIMKKKWIAIIGTGVLVTGLAVAGASFAKSANSGVRDGTIRLAKQV
jgi:hypothetical protein